MTWRTLRYDAIASYKAENPDHGLPDDIDSVSIEYSVFDVMCDAEAYDSAGNLIPPLSISVESFGGLAEYAKQYGDPTR